MSRGDRLIELGYATHQHNANEQESNNLTHEGRKISSAVLRAWSYMLLATDT